MGKNQDPGSGINIPDPQHCATLGLGVGNLILLSFLAIGVVDTGVTFTTGVTMFNVSLGYVVVVTNGGSLTPVKAGQWNYRG
jgi:hypothetical protein